MGGTGGSSGGPWEVLWAPWEVPWGPLGGSGKVLWGPLGAHMDGVTSLGVPWGVPEHECEALGGHWQSLGRSLEILGGPKGRPWGSLGVPGGIPGGTKNGGCSRGVSWDGPGRPYGCFWRYWAIFGPVLRCQAVVISMVLVMTLEVHVFPQVGFQ